MHSCFCAPLLSLSVLCRSYLKICIKRVRPLGSADWALPFFAATGVYYTYPTHVQIKVCQDSGSAIAS